MIKLKVNELNEQTFAKYGKVISSTSKSPSGDNDEFTFWDKVSIFGTSDDISTGILIAKKRDFCGDRLAKHVNTPEMVVALEGDSIVVVGTSSEHAEDDIQEIEAFKLSKGEAILIGKGIWHWAPLPLTDDIKFLISFVNDTPANDVLIKELDEPYCIDI